MKLETSEGEIDDIAYEIAEAAWKDFGATEEARYPRARLEAAIRKALAERAPPPPLMTVPKDALLEMLRTGSSMVYVNSVPGEVWRAPPLPAEVEKMRGKLEARVAIIEAFVREINASPGGEHEKLATELRSAASLLSRWPGLTLISDAPEGVTLDAIPGAALQKESTG